MTYTQIIEVLQALNPEALLLEPRPLYDPCVIGVTNTPSDTWPRETDTWVAVYDADKCIQTMAEEVEQEDREFPDGEDAWQVAVDNFEYNVAGSWVGENTPTFRYFGAE